jgi:putative heme-binding domain-containing protein
MASRRKAFSEHPPEAATGAQIFEKNCAVCHQLGGKGAKVGPQLDGVGSRGIDRLMEDVLDPNRNVDQTFRTTSLALENGQIISGLLLREDGKVLVIANAQGKEVRVPSDAVEEKHVSQLSPMPANFADQIPEADFNRLLAYLLSKREPTSPAAGKVGGR